MPEAQRISVLRGAHRAESSRMHERRRAPDPGLRAARSTRATTPPLDDGAAARERTAQLAALGITGLVHAARDEDEAAFGKMAEQLACCKQSVVTRDWSQFS
ncbi:MAG TPA: hypothetical protein PJ986_08680 [Gammaproteobacteria bacterium]|nr:hypothetical protein [Gammaproteobacteria bacterium]